MDEDNQTAFLGIELAAFLTLQKALENGGGRCGKDCKCAGALNEKILQINGAIAKLIGKQHAANFYEKKLDMVNKLCEEDPAIFRDINTAVHTKKLPQKIKNGEITLHDLHQVFRIKYE